MCVFVAVSGRSHAADDHVWCVGWFCVLQEFLMKEFEHPIDYALESALPRLEAWGLVTINSQVRHNCWCCACCTCL